MFLTLLQSKVHPALATPAGVNPWEVAKKRQDMQREEVEIIAIVKAIAKTMF